MAEEKDKEKEKEQDKDSEKATQKSGFNIKTIFLVGLLVVLLAGGLAFGVTKLVMSSISPSASNGAGPAENNASTEVGALFDAGEFLANISSDNGPRVVKVKITFDLTDEKMAEEINTKLPKIQDTILSILRSKTAEEVQSPDATEKLKTEIKDKINEFVNTGRVSDVYFTYFILQ